MIRIRPGSPIRLPYFLVALLLTVMACLFSLSDRAAASGQVQYRSIMLSNSAGGASGVSYQVSFTPSTTSTIQGIIVDFCSNDPIIGDSCTAPTGFSVGSPTVDTTTGADTGLGGGWTALSANGGRTLELLNGAGAAVGNTGPVIFTMSGVTNPNTTNTTFYGRILTYALTGTANAYTDVNPGNYVDFGGTALSTAQPISVTAKVQEQISFCVLTYPTAPLLTCSGGGNGVTLGDNNGVLNTAGVFLDKSTEYQISTNASHAANINIEGTAPYFAPAAHYIAALTAAATSLPGTEQFGICTYGYAGYDTDLTTNANYSGGGAGLCAGTVQTAGTITPGGDNGATFYFGGNMASTYGDTIASVTAGGENIGIVPMIGNIMVSTPAGVYTTALNFIATGTY